MLKWYGHALSMEDSRWSKRIKNWSPEGGRKGKPEMKWEREVERELMQKI
jgi:hypothetical protein